MRIVTAADQAYYSRLVSLIGSLHHSNFDHIQSIHVYDLGLTQKQRQLIRRLALVKLCRLPPEPPHLLRPYRKHQCGDTDTVVGLYTWKPIIFRSELEATDSIIWIDAGMTILGSLAPMWNQLAHDGYVLFQIHPIGLMTTRLVREQLAVQPAELDANGIHAGIQGVSRRVLDQYITPMSHYAQRLDLFQDDGSALGGPTMGRHDQTLFSLTAARAHMQPHQLEDTVLDGVAVRLTSSKPRSLDHSTMIYFSGGDSQFGRDPYLRYT